MSENLYPAVPLVSLDKMPENFSWDDASSDSSEDFEFEGRLFTAIDAHVPPNIPVHPIIRPDFDAMSDESQKSYMRCPMRLHKQIAHVELLKALEKPLGQNEKFDPELIASLAIQIPNAMDEKKWQCGVAGCVYIGTRQHVIAHMKKKDRHLNLKLYPCTHKNCNHLSIHPHDLKRHIFTHLSGILVTKGPKAPTAKGSKGSKKLIKKIDKTTCLDHSARPFLGPSTEKEMRPTEETISSKEAHAAIRNHPPSFTPVPSAPPGLNIWNETSARYSMAGVPLATVHRGTPYRATTSIHGPINEYLCRTVGPLDYREQWFQYTPAEAPHAGHMLDAHLDAHFMPPATLPPPVPGRITAAPSHYQRYPVLTAEQQAVYVMCYNGIPAQARNEPPMTVQGTGTQNKRSFPWVSTGVYPAVALCKPGTNNANVFECRDRELLPTRGLRLFRKLSGLVIQSLVFEESRNLATFRLPQYQWDEGKVNTQRLARFTCMVFISLFCMLYASVLSSDISLYSEGRPPFLYKNMLPKLPCTFFCIIIISSSTIECEACYVPAEFKYLSSCEHYQ
ncbi:hypothetical protein M408DRAFT_289609 [Serendipita vermifera MAFF 305830]|uniref:Uncharacterized protein n=1 Tax=Serendipita vermifera MAFF 305830 TaxID=933852 RepID=A0A0C2XNZ3_SERVB|nr:hypothetical protein M408DRAFT_289609 [Serendipita vermifera MAFF 305830]